MIDLIVIDFTFPDLRLQKATFIGILAKFIHKRYTTLELAGFG